MDRRGIGPSSVSISVEPYFLLTPGAHVSRPETACNFPVIPEAWSLLEIILGEERDFFTEYYCISGIFDYFCSYDK